MVAPVASLTIPAELQTIREGSQPTQTVAKAGEGEFSDVFSSMVASANMRAQAAREGADAFASGARDDIHGTMLAMSRADIELRVVGAVRNRVIDAFYELWRMQI
jgi:flagellar hook-basal body complex protein FliE